MVRFKRPDKRRFSAAEIKQIAREIREQESFKNFIFQEVREQEGRTRLMRRLIDKHEQRIIDRIRIGGKNIFRFVRA
jgi:hypothetical protein